MNKNLLLSLTTAVAVMFACTSHAQTPATITDLLGNNPTPTGPDDILVLDESNSGEPSGLNYYIDNGNPPGEIFLTPNTHPGGYVLTNLSIVMGGGSGGGINTFAQPYLLRIYSYDPASSNTVLLATYQSQDFTYFTGDWVQWSGVSVGLAANSYYAFTFNRGAQGWEMLGAESGDEYPAGQAVLIPKAGGQLTPAAYSTVAGWDANMDIGLLVAPFIVNAPTIAPATVVSTGQSATITSGSVLGAVSYAYQWQTDGGSGNTPTNIPGATGSSITVSYNQIGVYNFDVVVTNLDTPSHPIATSASAALTVSYPPASATLTDIGTTIVPGTYDIDQLNGGGSGDGLNYYDNNSDFPGQSFTTGTNPAGYTLQTLAVKTGGGGGTISGNNVAQPYYLFIYKVDPTGSNAVVLQEYTNASFTFAANGDWLQWSGLNLFLAPTNHYAFAFANYNAFVFNNAYGWVQIDSSTTNSATTNGNSTYTSGGELCLILSTGGALFFGADHGSNPPCSAVFDVGLQGIGLTNHSPQPGPIQGVPSAPVLAGTQITLTESAQGDTPRHYTWKTDNGTGGSFTAVGTDSTSLAVDTTGWAPGVYKYEVTVHNNYGPDATAPAVSITILYANASAVLTDLGLTAPTPGANDISQMITAGGPLKPDTLNYYDNNSSAPAGQTFTTGGNSTGYILKSVAINMSGDFGGLPTNGQPYYLSLYKVVNGGSTAVPYAFYTSQTNATIDSGGSGTDWLQWTGISLPLAANTTYAYTHVSSGSGWDCMGSVNTAGYAGGEVCLISPDGGAITYGSSDSYDATFDLGLNLNVTISVQPVGANLQLTWSAGAMLLQAPSLTGPWTTNSLATSPYTVTPSAGQRFYRAQLP